MLLMRLKRIDMVTSNKLTIACTTNERYIPFTRTFLQSIRDNSPGCDIYIRFVNCQHSSVHEIINAYDIDNFTFETLTLSTERRRLSRESVPIHEFVAADFKKNISKVKGARWLFSDEMSYCSNIRFTVINELLNKGTPHILYSDVDTIVNRDLTLLLEVISNNDISVRVDTGKDADNISYPNRPITEPGGMLYHMGLLGVNNTKTSRDVFRQIEGRVREDMSDWDTDHVEFFKVVEPLRQCSIIKLHELSRSFKDEGEDPVTGEQDGFKESSYIWSGAGDIKYTNEQYNDASKNFSNCTSH